MPKPYSTDLRERAVEAVESGASRREVAEMFKLGVSSVIRWCRRWTETGSAEPKRSGGSVSPLEEHSDWILALIAKQPDLTLEEILAAMGKQGIPGSRSAVQRGESVSKCTRSKAMTGAMTWGGPCHPMRRQTMAVFLFIWNADDRLQVERNGQ